MNKQLNIFEQEQIRRSKRLKDKFYAGVRERYEEEKRQQDDSACTTISIKYGVIATADVIKRIKNKH